jgi:hypothetical protein
MKRFMLAVWVSALVLSACGNHDDAAHKVAKESEKPLPEIKGMATPQDEATQRMNDLKKMTPLSLEDLTALLPAEWNGMKRSGFNSSNSMGYSFAGAHYQKGSSGVDLMLYDCAGEAGSAWYSASYQTKMNMKQENENDYMKWVDFKGGKAIETYKKDSKQGSLTFVGNKQVLVILSGNKVSPENLKELAGKLDLQPGK